MAFAPIQFPSHNFEEFDLKLVRTRDTAFMEDRRTEDAEFGTPYWALVSAQTPYLTDRQLDDWEAFFTDADRAGQTVLVHDVRRPRPRAYGTQPLSGVRAGGGAFDGTAQIYQIINRRSIIIRTLPAGFQVNRSALVGFRMSSLLRSLHRVRADAVASGTGEVTLSIEPGLPEIITGVATVDFEKPAVPMIVNPDWSLPKSKQSRRASLTAVEAFLG